MKKNNFFTFFGSKTRNMLKSLCIMAIGVVFFTTCKLGVGETVDVLPPELLITQPSQTENAIIRGEFIVKGTAKDDVALGSVTIALNDILGTTIPLENNRATVTGTTWSIALNTPNENNVYPIKDGDYTITVSATDTSGRSSVITSNISIDNTAPVVYIEQPGSSTNAEAYGTRFNIKGQAFDPNIEKIIFYAYNSKTLEEISSIEIPLESAAIDAFLGSFDITGEQTENFYTTLYGSVFEGSKDFRYFVVAYDKARTYTDSGKGSAGNENTHYYLHSQVNAEKSASTVYNYMSYASEDADKGINDKVFPHAIFPPHVVNGDVTLSQNESAANESTRIPNTTKNNLGLFSLFPSTAPTYYAIDKDKSLSSFPFTNILLGSSLLDVTLNTNNDGDALNFNTVTIRALQLKDGSAHYEADGTLKKDLLPAKDASEFDYTRYYSAAYKLFPIAGSNEDSRVNATYSLLQKGIKSDIIDWINPHEVVTAPSNKPDDIIDLAYGSYIIEVIGSDVKDSAFYNSEGIYYGFERISGGFPPTLTVDEMKGLLGLTVDVTHEDVKPYSVSIDENLDKSSSVVSFSGKVRSEIDDVNGDHKINRLEYILSGGNIQNAKTSVIDSSVKPSAIEPEKIPSSRLWSTDDNKTQYEWSFSLTHEDFASPTTSQQYKLVITAVDSTGVRDSEEYTIDYDLDRPAISSLTHSVSIPEDNKNDKTISVDIRSADNSNAFTSGNIAYKVDKPGVVDEDASTGSRIKFELIDTVTKIPENTVLKPIESPRRETISFSLNEITGQVNGSIPADKTVKATVIVVDQVELETMSYFVLDTLPPTLSNAKISSPENPSYIWIDENDNTNTKNWYYTGTLTLSVSSEDLSPENSTPSGVRIVEWTADSLTEPDVLWQPLTLTNETWTGNTSFTESGSYTLHFRATDASLNVSELFELPFSIDREVPISLALDTIQGTAVAEGVSPIVYTNATEKITVVFKSISDDETISDGTSGIKSIRLSKIGNMVFDEPSEEDDTDNIEPIEILNITTEQILAAVNGGAPNGGAVTFILTDNVGNTAEFVLFTLSIDITPPEVIINTPSSNAVVNGVVTISGTANDNSNEISSLYLEYEKEDGSWEKIDEEVDNVFGWSLNINTTEARFDFAENAGSHLNVRVVATDTGSNIHEEHLRLQINQDDDRSIVTITNLNLDGMSKDNRVWLKGSGGSTATLSGIVTDDDGAISEDNFRIIIDGRENSPTDYSNGTWSYNLGSSGPRDIGFKISDGNLEFTSIDLGSNPSEEDLQQSPKITDGSNNFGYNTSVLAEKGSTIRLTVDTDAPSISNIVIDTTPRVNSPWFDDSTETLFEDNMVIGGESNIVALKFSATDDNEINSVTMRTDINTTEQSVSSYSPEENAYVALINTTDEASYTQNGTTIITLTVTDAAGEVTTRDLPVYVDNVAPTISIVNPLHDDTVSGAVSVTGRVDTGGSGASLPLSDAVRFIFPVKESNGWRQPLAEDSGWKSVTSGSSSWQIRFDGEPGNYDTLSAFIEEHAHEILETDGDKVTHTNIWKLPIVFRYQDSLGNEAISNVEDYILRIDPDGDKPKVSVISPTPEASESSITLGGTIRIFGSAEDNEGVKAVYMQIDTDNDGSFDDDDRDILKAVEDKGVKVYNIETIDPDPKPEGSDPESWWGIKVTGTNSWNTTINKEGEFNPVKDENDPIDKTNPIRYRVRSVDIQEAVSLWSEPITIEVDNTAPRIGSTESLKLVQYHGGASNGTIIAEKDYEPDMWLNGTWYLTGSIEDESGVASINVSGDLNGDEGTSNWFDAASFDTNLGYRMNVPIADGTGQLEFTLKVEDSSSPSQTSTRSFSINRNNTKPTLSALENSADVVIDNDVNTVQQSNGSFTFGSTVKESGGGLSHVAFWFERPAYESLGKRIFNVMEDNILTNLEDDPSSGEVGIINGLPRLHLTGVTRDSETTLEHDIIKDNLNVRVGSLVYIGGIDRTITAVEEYTLAGTDTKLPTGKITFSPSVDVSYTEADIAYVMLVNNRKIETASATEGEPPINDDGDGMVESVEGSNQNYTWSASIDSRNIPDGPIIIHAVAYDVSGLASETRSISTRIENNRPAIANITLQTDLNASGDITDTDQKVVYSTLDNSNQPVKEAIVDASGNGESAKFIAKGITHLIPEVVGGNGDLYYSLQTEGYNLAVSDATKIRIGSGENIAQATLPIALELTDGKLLGLNDTNGTAREFSFSIWDSTEETTKGVNSQRATLDLTMHVHVTDTAAPNTSISPFYWNSESDNSLYDNDRENGHIDLEADLPDEFTDGVSGINDRDPKVSGKVSFRGKANDSTVLKELWAKIDNFTFNNNLGSSNAPADGFVKIAEFIDETEVWNTGNNDLTTNDWSLEVINVEHSSDEVKDSPVVDQDGHSIRWTLHWDSQAINATAQADVNVQIIAVDSAENSGISSYKIDVVPYITSVTTNLSNYDAGGTTASRTVLGNYPVYVGETAVSLQGFNIASNATVTISNSTINGVTGVENGVSFTIPEVTSGNVDVSVSTITSLNNKNASIDANNKTIAYNSVPAPNNNNLMDDVKFDVWNTNDSLSNFINAGGAGPFFSPELRIKPNDGTMGFAYTRDDYYYMPGKENGSETHSAVRQIERGWAPYYESTIAFDNAGNSYGLSTNTDTSIGGYSAYTTFFFDRVGYTPSKSQLATVAQASSHQGGTFRRRIMSTSTETQASENRVKSPSMATTFGDSRSNSEPTAVYLAYYDVLSDHIRYQWGTVGSTLELDATIAPTTGIITASGHGFTGGEEVTLQYGYANRTFEKLHSTTQNINRRFFVVEVSGNTFRVSLDGSTPLTSKAAVGFTDSKNNIRVSAIGGQLKDITGGYMDKDEPTDNKAADMATNKYSIIAGKPTPTDSEPNPAYEPVSEHVSLDARKISGNDLVVITFTQSGNLMYAYSTDPRKDTDTVGEDWIIQPKDEGVSMYSDVKIDANGGIHIAYASDNQVLKYAYLEPTTYKKTIVEVDSYDSVGNYLRLSLKEDGNNIVPYISYYSTSLSLVKLAYKVQSGVVAGVENGMFTGNWEVTHIPSPNSPREDTINVAINNKHDGKIQGDGANGTANPAIAYSLANKDGLEVAQKR